MARLMFGPYVLAAALVHEPAALAESYILQKQQPACVSRDTWNRVLELMAAQDDDAVDALFSEKISEGECRVFNPGDVVLIETSEWETKLAKVHLEGDPRPYWIMLMGR